VNYDYFLRGNPQNAPARPGGGVALMGGSTDQDPAFRFMAQRADGGDFLVLRASGAGDYNEYIEGLGQLDSVETLVLHDREASSDAFVLDRIRGADAIFFAGGDQSKYMEFWAGTPVAEELNKAIERGVPIGGTSAGLAILGETVFSARVGETMLTSAEALVDPFDPKLTLEPAFLDVPHMQGVLTDTHFSQRERMGRLVTMMARAHQDGNPVRGLGVDERTAVLLEPEGRGWVVGENTAWFVTAPGPAEVCVPGQPLTFKNLQVQKLQAGESFDFRTWQADGSPTGLLSVEAGSLLAEPQRQQQSA
jgi:cyanophycinase